MTPQDVFDPDVARHLVQRIRSLEPDTRPRWGKMDVARMLAHCSVPYEFAFEDVHPRAGPVKRFFLRLLAKPTVTGPKPYRRSLPTTSAFRIADERDFGTERERLIAYVKRTAEEGEDAFDGREHPFFGALTADEWRTLLYKHLDHHLTQFGA